ncbi:unnamed protein product [Mesocestoides corti]|uniref:Vacuolar protein sorting-associated protein 51 homolog n=1 Tax=Mesocestoides corti TaxID=53468 RepID=A0A158QTJ2_MESCO|nr:unnamed protein product [Mesocestoides corti]
MLPDPQDRLERKKRLLEFYGPKSNSEVDDAATSSDPRNIDSSDFDTKAYLSDLLRKCDLNDLMSKDSEIGDQIRSLDSEMQTLVYDNYNKFLSATDTIKMMKSDFKFIEEEMNILAESMVEISRFTSEIDQELWDTRTAIKKLTATAENLQKLSYLSSLPGKIRDYMSKEEWARAVEAYCRARGFFEKHRNVPSFQGIDKECAELICVVASKLEARLLSAEDPSALTSSIELLKKLGRTNSTLSKMFLQVTSQRVDLLLEKLTQSLAVSKANDDDDEEATVAADVLQFANTATDTVLDGLLSYVFAYSSRFLSSAGLSEGDGSSDAGEGDDDDDGSDLEGPLFECIKSATYKFFSLIDAKMREEVQSSDTGLVVRALERLYSRLMGFSCSVLEVVAPNDPSPAANDFRRCLDDACLELLLRTACRCCEKHFALLKLQAADCLTDIRQQLVTSPCTASGTSEVDGETPTLTEIYDEMSRVLATNLRDCLKLLEAFLSSDNTFAHIQSFRANFCLEYVREGIVTAYLRFLIQFCDDLSKCTPSSIPGTLILLLGKLCLDWANSGTVGHLLSTADDFILIGVPKSSTTVLSRQQAIQQMLATRQQPLTAPGPLAEEFRTTATHLLTTYVKFEGAQIAHMMRKSVEARDWLRCLEPRTVRSVVRRILEDLTVIDLQISQLLPPSSAGRSRGKDVRGSGDTYYSWRFSTPQRPGQSMVEREGAASRPPLASSQHRLSLSSSSSAAAAAAAWQDNDPALASQLRRLFFQHVDMFAPVKPTRESILFGVIKIGLKAFGECARIRVFGKFGLQQIQVDCHYLHIHLWKFVNDDKQVQVVLDDVMYSVMQRCVEPQLMENSIVDAICDTSRTGSNLSK